jgi:hypothetical protein
VTHSCLVRAKDAWCDTGLDIRQGEHWAFEATGIWCDWYVRCGPEGYSSALLWLWRNKKRVPTAPWFCLIGAIGTDPSAVFAIGAGRPAEAFSRSGRLYAFANDHPDMYWNNSGAITLTAIAY